MAACDDVHEMTGRNEIKMVHRFGDGLAGLEQGGCPGGWLPYALALAASMAATPRL